MNVQTIRPKKKYVALSGGVGGAKLALGLSQVLPEDALTIIVNTGDDFEHLGLHISPDVDTLLYTLSGRANREQGWGLTDETWTFLQALKDLGGETWFQLGDKDLATHVTRTARLRSGDTLTSTTRYLASQMGIPQKVLPMSDDPVRTCVATDKGVLEFQRYFVLEQCRPSVKGFRFSGIEKARPTRLVEEALSDPNLAGVILCPSNPFVSMDPILSLQGMGKLLADVVAPIVAVSPIVGGNALKGPAAKMMHELGLDCTTRSVAEKYRGLITGYVLDQIDGEHERAVSELGLQTLVTDTVMVSDSVKQSLANDILHFLDRLTETVS